MNLDVCLVPLSGVVAISNLPVSNTVVFIHTSQNYVFSCLIVLCVYGYHCTDDEQNAKPNDVLSAMRIIVIG